MKCDAAGDSNPLGDAWGAKVGAWRRGRPLGLQRSFETHPASVPAPEPYGGSRLVVTPPETEALWHRRNFFLTRFVVSDSIVCAYGMCEAQV